MIVRMISHQILLCNVRIYLSLDENNNIGEGEITLNASGCDYVLEYTEVISGQDDECNTEYTITRTWTITDCVDNVRTHTQIITVLDTTAPVFVESLPADITTTCSEVPEAAILTALDNCDPDVSVFFEENISNDANCANGYTIIRTWSASDCAGNKVSHSQVITIPPSGPITAGDYEEELMITCGQDIPEVPILNLMGGCGDFIVVYNEESQSSEETDDYMIIRIWEVTDSCNNMETFEQIICDATRSRNHLD